MNKQFYIAGVQFHELKHIIKDLKAGMVLDLVPEPDNKFDPNAVRIEYDETMLGYIPKTHSAEISAILEIEDLECVIETIDPTNSPWEQCLVNINKKETQP